MRRLGRGNAKRQLVRAGGGVVVRLVGVGAEVAGVVVVGHLVPLLGLDKLDEDKVEETWWADDYSTTN